MYVRMKAYRMRSGNGRRAAASNSASHSCLSDDAGMLTRAIVGQKRRLLLQHQKIRIESDDDALFHTAPLEDRVVLRGFKTNLAGMNCMHAARAQNHRRIGRSILIEQAASVASSFQPDAFHSREERRLALVLLPQGLKASQEARAAPVSRGCIAEIDQETDGAIVARGLFRRDEVGDLRPNRRLSPYELAEVRCARRCPLGLAPLSFGFGSRCFRAPAFIAKLLCDMQKCGNRPRFA